MYLLQYLKLSSHIIQNHNFLIFFHIPMYNTSSFYLLSAVLGNVTVTWKHHDFRIFWLQRYCTIAMNKLLNSHKFYSTVKKTFAAKMRIVVFIWYCKLFDTIWIVPLNNIMWTMDIMQLPALVCFLGFRVHLLFLCFLKSDMVY